MKKFEYWKETLRKKDYYGAIELAYLNTMGEKGWELCSTSQGEDMKTYLFKREKE